MAEKKTPRIRFEGFTDLPAGRQAIGKWCVYVLKCDDGSLYKGKTNDLARRVNEHITGQGAQHTKKHKPIKLVYFEAFSTEKEALEKEKYLKSGSGREWLKNNLQKYKPFPTDRPVDYDTDPWEQCKVGDCFTERQERSENGELISVTINDGIKKFSELGRHDNSSDDKSNYKCVRKGDIAYNSMRMWQGASGYSPYTGILSPAYTVIIPNSNMNSRFFAFDFKREPMIHEFQLRSQGISSDTWNLKYPALKEIEIFVPNIDEQNKIAEYFNAIDSSITLHQRKVEKLQMIKKSMLDKMFV